MSEAKGAPRRALGIWTCTALVIGNMVGSGIFLLPASLAEFGTLSIIGWALTALGAICLALVFARLARLVPKAGGPYAYTRAGYGDFAAFWIAWGYWIAVWAGNAAVAVAFVSYLTVFFPVLGDSQMLAGLTAIASVWLVTLVNCRGVKEAGLVQLVTTILKMLPLLAIGTIGLFWLEPGNFVPVNPSELPTFSALSVIAALTLWSFLGLESATVPAGDVENPRKTIPRATVAGTLIAAIVYMLSMTALLGAVPRETLSASPAPFAVGAEMMFGNWAYYAVGLGAIVSCFGTMNGFTLLQGQVPMAAARDKLFPSRFAAMSASGVPAFGIIVSSGLMTLLLMLRYSGSGNLVDVFEFIILLATLTTLMPYAFCAIAEFLIYFSDPQAFSGERMLGAAIIGTLAFVYSVWAVFGSGAETVFYGFMLLLLGLPVYLWMRHEQAQSGRSAAGPQIAAGTDD